jgi:hypothetical protein
MEKTVSRYGLYLPTRCIQAPQRTTYVPERLAQVEFRTTRITLYIWSKYVCIYKAVQLKSKLHYTGTWSAAAWPPRRLCYRPAALFCHLRLTALLFSQGKIRCAFNKCCYLNFFILLNGISLKLRKLWECLQAAADRWKELGVWSEC